MPRPDLQDRRTRRPSWPIRRRTRASRRGRRTPASCSADLAVLDGLMVIALITSPALMPARAAGESGVTATTGSRPDSTGPGRDVDGSWLRRGSIHGGESSGVDGEGLGLAAAVGGRPLDLEGHRLARRSRWQMVGQLHRVEVVVAVDLDDPVPLAEPGRLGGRAGLDRADRLDRQPEAEVDEMRPAAASARGAPSTGPSSPTDADRRSMTCLIGRSRMPASSRS